MISDSLKSVISGLRGGAGKLEFGTEGPFISVNQLTGRASVFYEKLRYMVDYKEEHTIRRSAIERILNRNLFIDRKENIGLALLEELVSSGYLENHTIPESLAHEVNAIIEKYLVLGTETHLPTKRTLALMASEVEHFLYPQKLNDLIAQSFFKNISKYIKYQGKIDSIELEAQIYLGVRRSLFDEDYETSFYALMVHYLPELPNISNTEEVRALAPRFGIAFNQSMQSIEHPLGWRISSRLKNHAVCYSTIREIFKDSSISAEEVLENPALLDAQVEKILEKKYQEQHDLITKSGMRAVIYILLTKIILAFLIELPYEKYVLGEVQYFALFTNVIFHPALLFMMVNTIPRISANNTAYIKSGVEQIVQGLDMKYIYLKPTGQGSLLETTFYFFYFILCTISFGVILWVLNALHFNIVSILLFLFFLTLVSYFGFRIRFNAKKWRFEVENNNFLNLLWNFFTLPIVRTGRWLSRKFATVNIFVLVMDFIIETPLKLVLGTFNSFVSFLREKREDPY